MQQTQNFYPMKLIRPTPPAESFLNPFGGLFSSSFGDRNAFNELFRLTGLPPSEVPSALSVDVYEDDAQYHARFEVPGVKKGDAKVELEDGVLTVSVERKTMTNSGESTYSLSRSISVPDSVLLDGIVAKLEDGLLTVTLPKQEQRKPRTIELN